MIKLERRVKYEAEADVDTVEEAVAMIKYNYPFAWREVYDEKHVVPDNITESNKTDE